MWWTSGFAKCWHISSLLGKCSHRPNADWWIACRICFVRCESHAQRPDLSNRLSLLHAVPSELLTKTYRCDNTHSHTLCKTRTNLAQTSIPTSTNGLHKHAHYAGHYIFIPFRMRHSDPKHTKTRYYCNAKSECEIWQVKAPWNIHACGLRRKCTLCLCNFLVWKAITTCRPYSIYKVSDDYCWCTLHKRRLNCTSTGSAYNRLSSGSQWTAPLQLQARRRYPLIISMLFVHSSFAVSHISIILPSSVLCIMKDEQRATANG